LGVTGYFKRFYHNLRQMVSHRAGGKLHAVAHDVVLPREDIKRVFGSKRLKPALRHGERIVRKFNRACFLVCAVHREIHDKAELKLVFID